MEVIASPGQLTVIGDSVAEPTDRGEGQGAGPPPSSEESPDSRPCAGFVGAGVPAPSADLLCRPRQEGPESTSKLFPFGRETIFDPNRNLGEGLPLHQVEPFHLLEPVRKRLVSDPGDPVP